MSRIVSLKGCGASIYLFYFSPLFSGHKSTEEFDILSQKEFSLDFCKYSEIALGKIHS